MNDVFPPITNIVFSRAPTGWEPGRRDHAIHPRDRKLRTAIDNVAIFVNLDVELGSTNGLQICTSGSDPLLKCILPL